jgi:hypothetical protein
MGWNMNARDISLENVLLSVLKELLSVSSECVAWSKYLEWPEPGQLKQSVHFKVKLSTLCATASSRSSFHIPLLQCISALERFVLGGGFSCTLQSVGATVLNILFGSPLLRTYAQELLQQPSSKTVIYMGYDSTSGEPSVTATVWAKCLSLVTAILATAREDSTESLLAFAEPLHKFLDTFFGLLLLPWNLNCDVYSVQSLELCRTSTVLLAEVLRIPVFANILPSAHLGGFIQAITKTINCFAGIVGDGSDASVMTMRRLLQQFSISISKQETCDDDAHRASGYVE